MGKLFALSFRYRVAETSRYETRRKIKRRPLNKAAR